MYLHIYFNEAKAVDEKISYNKMLDAFEEELFSEKRNPEHEKHYARYYNITTTPVRGVQITPKQEAIDDAEKLWLFCSDEQQHQRSL